MLLFFGVVKSCFYGTDDESSFELDELSPDEEEDEDSSTMVTFFFSELDYIWTELSDDEESLPELEDSYFVIVFFLFDFISSIYNNF